MRSQCFKWLSIAVIALVGSVSALRADDESVWSFLNPTEGLADTQESATDIVDPNEAMQKIHNDYTTRTRAKLSGGGSCNAKNVRIRKEWGNMSGTERRAFNSAFFCLVQLPSRTPHSVAPGARNRLDDFVVLHITNLPDIHFSPWILLWHRYVVHLVEKALQDECGYPYMMPYWDWSKYLDGPQEENPLFDGSDTSISGNGDIRNRDCACVNSGPYSNWTVNLGPVGTGVPCGDNPQSDGLGYNPRCLERRWNPGQLANMQYQNVTDSILGSNDITAFSTGVENPTFGIHVLPHTFVGGLQNNIHSSASDVWFFGHHSGLDRAWSMWQAQDFDTRTDAISDADAYDNLRSRSWGRAPTVRLDTVVPMSPMYKPITAREIMSPTDGPFCYMYD